jgi:hypothetical protein
LRLWVWGCGCGDLGFVYSMLRLGLGVLDFWVFGFCVLGCRIWELRFGLESWGVWILLVFGLSFEFGCWVWGFWFWVLLGFWVLGFGLGI